MATVLVTGVGGACGIGAIRSLHDQPKHDIVGVDMDPQAAGIFLADEGRKVPPAAADDWAEAMGSVVDEFDIDVVIPTVDEELAALPSLLNGLSSDVPVIAPDPSFIDDALDKYRTYRRLAEAGHPVPETWLATEEDAIDASAFPLIVKPRRGRGSRGVRIVDDRADLAMHLDETDVDPESLLLQSFVDGTEFTTSVVGTADGRLLGVVPKEAIEKRGSTTIGVTREAPTIRSSCQQLFETLAPRGPINVQQILDERGTPYVIEINPRFSSTSCLTVAAGVDEFDLLIRDALGESVSPVDEFETDLYLRRYQDHVFVEGQEFQTPETVVQ